MTKTWSKKHHLEMCCIGICVFAETPVFLERKWILNSDRFNDYDHMWCWWRPEQKKKPSKTAAPSSVMEFFDIGAGAVTLFAIIITLIVIIVTLVLIIVTLVVIMVTNSKGWLCLEILASTFLSLRSQSKKLLLSCCDVTNTIKMNRGNI